MSRNHWIQALTLAAATAAAACGGSAQEAKPPRHLIGNEPQAAAPANSKAPAGQSAAPPTRESQTQTAPSVGCFDQSIPDPDSGGERIHVLRPCWTEATPPVSVSE